MKILGAEESDYKEFKIEATNSENWLVVNETKDTKVWNKENNDSKDLSSEKHRKAS